MRLERGFLGKASHFGIEKYRGFLGPFNRYQLSRYMIVYDTISLHGPRTRDTTLQPILVPAQAAVGR